MILANFSQICQSQISLADLTILTNFRHFRYCMHFWTYQDFCTTPYYCKTKPKSQMEFNVFLYMICTQNEAWGCAEILAINYSVWESWPPRWFQSSSSRLQGDLIWLSYHSIRYLKYLLLITNREVHRDKILGPIFHDDYKNLRRPFNNIVLYCIISSINSYVYINRTNFSYLKNASPLNYRTIYLFFLTFASAEGIFSRQFGQ